MSSLRQNHFRFAQKSFFVSAAIAVMFLFCLNDGLKANPTGTEVTTFRSEFTVGPCEPLPNSCPQVAINDDATPSDFKKGLAEADLVQIETPDVTIPTLIVVTSNPDELNTPKIQEGFSGYRIIVIRSLEDLQKFNVSGSLDFQRALAQAGKNITLIEVIPPKQDLFALREARIKSERARMVTTRVLFAGVVYTILSIADGNSIGGVFVAFLVASTWNLAQQHWNLKIGDWVKRNNSDFLTRFVKRFALAFAGVTLYKFALDAQASALLLSSWIEIAHQAAVSLIAGLGWSAYFDNLNKSSDRSPEQELALDRLSFYTALFGIATTAASISGVEVAGVSAGKVGFFGFLGSGTLAYAWSSDLSKAAVQKIAEPFRNGWRACSSVLMRKYLPQPALVKKN